jgi:hypothetical protein
LQATGLMGYSPRLTMATVLPSTCMSSMSGMILGLGLQAGLELVKGGGHNYYYFDSCLRIFDER